MGEVITEKDKEYEAQERAAAPGDGDRGAGLVLKGMPACIEGAIEG